MKKKDPTSHRIIEKRRRDRMNNCLADLSKLIPAHYMKKGRGRIEKTEIIEMAIKHLKDLIGQTSASSFQSPAAAANTNTATLATTAATTAAGAPENLAEPSVATAPTTNKHNGTKPNAGPNGQAAHYQTGGQLAPPASRDKHPPHSDPLDIKSTEQMASSSNSSSSSSLSSLSPGDNRLLASSQSDNSCTPMMICSDNLEPSQAASRSKRKAPPIAGPEGHQRHHHVNSFISDQDFKHLANVNKTLATIKMEPSSPPSASSPLPLPLPHPLPLVTATSSSTAITAPTISSNNSYHNHFHSGSSSHHHHHHHHHHAQTSANSACFNGSAASACPLNAPAVATTNDSSGSSSEGLATETPSASGPLTSAAHQHHHQLHKYRSSPNSSGSDSGGSSSSFGSSGDNGAGSSGNMSGSSSGHRAGGSSCSMRTSCSSSSVTSMNPGNPNRPIGLVVDRGTTTSLQAAMAAATVTVNKPVGADTSAGSSSSSLNSISSDVMMAFSPVRSLPGNGTVASGAAVGSGDGVIECCTCGARILQTSKQQRANNGGGSSSDSSSSSNGAGDKPTALANKSQSANNQSDPDSLDFSGKTMIGAGKQAMTSNKRRASNGDNKCNNLAPGFMRPGSLRHHSNSSTSSHLSPHSASNSTSPSTSNSSLSLTSSNSSAAWYKKAWLVRSFSRSPTPR